VFCGLSFGKFTVSLSNCSGQVSRCQDNKLLIDFNLLFVYHIPMLTKGDLSAIKSIVKDEVRTIVKGEIENVRTEMKDLRTELKDEVNGLRIEVKNEIKGLGIEIKGLGTEIKNVRTELKEDIKNVRTEILTYIKKNTDDLVEMINTGFSTHEVLRQDHEERIIRLEKTTFPTN